MWSAGDGDPARPVLLGPLQAQAQRPVLELRLDPFRVDPERVEAQLENGVLRLSLQRPEEDKPRRIAITG